jgi:cardiolipin synthase
VHHVPNAITVLRLLLIPVQLMLLVQRRYDAALLLFALSALSDFADGYIARRWNAHTRFGAIADPVADKLTMLAVTLALGAQGLLPVWVVAAIIVRDLVIVGGALAYHCLVGRYDMAPSVLSKLNTAIEFLVLASVLAGAAGLIDVSAARPPLFGLLLLTIVASGTHYVWVWGRLALRHRARRDVPAGH